MHTLMHADPQEDRPEKAEKAKKCVTKAWEGTKGIGEFSLDRVQDEDKYREMVCMVEDKSEFGGS